VKEKDFVIEDDILVEYSGKGGDIIIPDGVRKIGKGWQWDTHFRDVENIDSITIPESVEEIVDGAFRFTKTLKRIEIPKSVKVIGRSAFWRCDSLEEVYIYGDSIKAYGKVFEDCSSLKRIVAPYLPLNTFSEPEVKPLMLMGYIEDPGRYEGEQSKQYLKYLISQRKKLIPILLKTDCVKGIKILADNKKIDADNFDEEYFQPASAANALQSIAFLLEWKNQNMSYDDKLQISDKEPEIKPLSLTELKKLWAFEEKGDSIVITDYKGDDEAVIIPDTIGDKKVIGLGEFVFSPEKPKRTAKRKPYFNSSIKSVIVPDGVTEIGNGAFLNCGGLKEIKLPKTSMSIGKEAFRGCENLANADGLIIINDVLYGFSKQTIKENVIIPDCVTVVGDRAFFECFSIKKVVLSKSVQSIGVSSFGECLALQEIEIPSSVCEIGAGAFFHCKELSKVEIPDAVKRIEDTTFMKCIQLKRVIIPKNVSQIGVWAFNQCNRLEEIVIECVDAEIGQWAFDNCAKLTVSVVKGSATKERVKEAGVSFKEV